jgi:uncharacterized membrane protein (DUF485 family)
MDSIALRAGLEHYPAALSFSRPVASRSTRMQNHDPQAPRSDSGQSRLGLALFFVYLLFYGGFVFLSAFAPGSMEQLGPGGVNLAVLYGFGLILGAVVLSAVYGVLCRTRNTDESGNKGGHQ